MQIVRNIKRFPQERWDIRASNITSLCPFSLARLTENILQICLCYHHALAFFCPLTLHLLMQSFIMCHTKTFFFYLQYCDVWIKATWGEYLVGLFFHWHKNQQHVYTSLCNNKAEISHLPALHSCTGDVIWSHNLWSDNHHVSHKTIKTNHNI